MTATRPTDAPLQLLQTSAVPSAGARHALYFRRADEDAAQSAFPLPSGRTLSFDAYFNAFFAGWWRHAVGLETVRFTADLQLAGAARLRLQARSARANRAPVYETTLEPGQSGISVELNLSAAAPDERWSVEIEALNGAVDAARFAFFAVEAPRRTVALAAVICTFRREAYLDRNLKVLLGAQTPPALAKVVVVDNGRTVNATQYNSEKLRLLPNENTGGAGGFARGAIEALSNPHVTHLLFMDDDIELQIESLQRTIAALRYTPENTAISGGMLDELRPTRLSGHGANYDALRMRYRPNKTDVDLTAPGALDHIAQSDRVSYGEFWYFAFPAAFARRHGLPLPLFIRNDDVEFGLRLTRHQGNILAQPGVAVWHAPFYAKDPSWSVYYAIRNSLITSALTRGAVRLPALLGALPRLWKELIAYRYARIRFMRRACEDFLKGPGFLSATNPGSLHLSVLADEYLASRALKPADVLAEPAQIAKQTPHKKNPFARLTTLALALTGNALWLPARAPASPVVQLDPVAPDYSLIFRAPRYWRPQPADGTIIEYRRNVRIALHETGLFLRVLARVWWRGNRVARAFCQAAPTLASVEFWSSYPPPASTWSESAP